MSGHDYMCKGNQFYLYFNDLLLVFWNCSDSVNVLLVFWNCSDSVKCLFYSLILLHHL